MHDERRRIEERVERVHDQRIKPAIYESTMLDYGTQDHGTFRPQLGDWSETIKSGRVQPARGADPAVELSPKLRELARTWGYPAQ